MHLWGDVCIIAYILGMFVVSCVYFSNARHLSFIAQVIPGKEEFYETIRYFKKQLELTGFLICYDAV